jgi:uncharacterized protein (DUF488 family)
MTEPLLTMFTIGFTRKSARTFFSMLRNAGVATLIDVRLNNSSQLAGYSKRDDLAFFCETVLGIRYQHVTALAPTQAMLDRFRKSDAGWRAYETEFLALMRERRIEADARAMFDRACLLCAEPTADHCHRRLVAEYLQRAWRNVEIVHL